VEAGDVVLLLLPITSCVTNTLVNTRTGEACEVWCR